MKPQAEETAAYRAGANLAVWLRPLMVIYVIVAGAFLAGAAAVPDRLRLPMTVGLVSAGVFLALGFVLTRWAFYGFLVLYLVIVGIGSRLAGLDPRPEAALVVVAVGSVVAAVGFMIASVRTGRKSTELERMIFAEGTSIAFFVTMIGAVTYSLLETWIDAPRLSMWVVWTVGMGSWFVLSLALRRRYA